MRTAEGWQQHLCWERYKKAENRSDFLRSSWIRPEDVQKYEPFIDVMKLATRQHISPRMIIGAYIAARSALDKKSREDEVKDAQREQRQQDQLEEIKQKLDIHNGYAEKLGDIQLDIAGIHKDIEYLRKRTKI